MELDSNNLESIIQRAKEMDNLKKMLRNVLNKEAAKHLISANIRRNGELVLLCNSSAWGSKIRFDQEKLLKIAQTKWKFLTSCRVKIIEKTSY
jgi:hypothetical protein